MLHSAPAVDSPAESPGAWNSWAAATALLLLGALLHVVYLLWDCPLGLAGDEAHYWEWSRRLDWSYYSKGPLVAWIIAAGRWWLADLSLRLLHNEVLAVRGPAIALSVLTGLGIYALGRVTLRSAAAGMGAVALSFTVPVLAAGSMLMTIDAPLMCTWVWALVCIEIALRRNWLWAWAGAGLLIAVGLLAKYNMILIFPVVAAAMAAEAGWRRAWRRPGPYLATAIGLLGLAPILAWNAQHDWVSFRHVAGQAGLSGGLHFNPAGPIEYVSSQFVVTNPIWFAAIWLAFLRIHRGLQGGGIDPALQPATRLMLLAGAVPWLVFIPFSFITKIQPNWPVLSIPAALVLLVFAWRCGLFVTTGRNQSPRGWLLAGVALGLGAVVILHRSEWIYPLLKPLARRAPAWDLTPMARYDPTVRLRGWPELGARVGRILAEEQAAGRDPFLLAEDYQLASEIAFYTPAQPLVYSAQFALGGRRSQYDLWDNPLQNPERFAGRPCIYIGSLHQELTGDGQHPAAMSGLHLVEVVTHHAGGEPVQIWAIHRAERYDGFAIPRTGTSNQY